MNLFKVLSVPPKTATPKTGVARQSLPELHSFVDIEIGAQRKESTSIDYIDADFLTTRRLPGLAAGTAATFTYNNSFGRFRFSTACADVDERQARFSMPAAISTVADWGTKRGAVRVASMLPASWRYAQGGAGRGDFVKGSIADLSRTGASLVVAADLQVKTHVQIRLTLNNTELTLMSEVVRAAKIATSGKSAAGIRFLDADSASEQLISEFIHERQTQRRQRGMV